MHGTYLCFGRGNRVYICAFCVGGGNFIGVVKKRFYNAVNVRLLKICAADEKNVDADCGNGLFGAVNVVKYHAVAEERTAALERSGLGERNGEQANLSGLGIFKNIRAGERRNGKGGIDASGGVSDVTCILSEEMLSTALSL